MTNDDLQKRLDTIKARIPETLARDRYGFNRRWRQLRQRLGGASSIGGLVSQVTRLEKNVAASAKTRDRRQARRPVPVYPQMKLPILERREAIIEAIATHPVVVVCGETGSGKTTQLPKFCLAAGRGAEGFIGCTQPRRIAAVTVAQRIAEEFSSPLGEMVGYKIRFQDRIRPHSYIKIMTDGILLAETQGDRFLNSYDTIIVDEAHERSLNIDFTLGILRNLVKRRKDLKVIITSATIDTEKFSKAFDNAPVIEVSGRMYPVELRYQPVAEEAEKTHVEAAVASVTALNRHRTPGDILVFMPTEQDIRDTCRLLEGRALGSARILPLFARLSAKAQRSVFGPSRGRKIIVATNVAETAITIPGIRFVIDSGLARIPHYSPRTRSTTLPVVPISRSSADQRKGRCGRVADGLCVRLYAESDYEARPLYTPPEIVRANLAEVMLRMIALGLGDPADFPFIDPPDRQSVRDGYNLLMELEAITPTPSARSRQKQQTYRLTENGRIMARLPIDPRLSRILIEAHHRHCLPAVTVIAAALSIQDPRERPAEKQAIADQAHAVWQNAHSDFITLLNLWHDYDRRLSSGYSNSRLRRFCSRSFISYRRMREWRDIHQQLRAIMADHDMPDAAAPRSDAAWTDRQGAFTQGYIDLHKAVLSGFLSNIAQRQEGNLYTAAKNKEVLIFPGSGIFNRAGKWIVAAEMVKTSRYFARCVATVAAPWIETVGQAQCRRTYLNPHWERGREAVVATEQVTLYGLILSSNRKVGYGRIDPEAATDIFIRSALVQGDVKHPLPFMVHNQGHIDAIHDEEERLRRRDLLIDEESLFDFYHQRLEHVWDIRSLMKMIKTTGGDDFLRVDQQVLRCYRPDPAELAQYPDQLEWHGARISLSYRYDPGHEADGVSLNVPSGSAGIVPGDMLDWALPGMLAEKITFLIKALPKHYRRYLTPVAATVETILAEMPRAKDPLLSALSAFISSRFGLRVPIEAWPADSLPDHLKPRLVITDHQGKVIRSGRDPALLHAKLPTGSPPPLLAKIRQRLERNDLRDWDFGDLPESVPLTTKDHQSLTAYPALEVAGEQSQQVNLRLFEQAHKARRSHPEGVCRLACHKLTREIKAAYKAARSIVAKIPATDAFGAAGTVAQRIVDQVAHNLLARDVRTQSAFMAMLADGGSRLQAQTLALATACLPVIEAYAELWRDLQKTARGHGGDSQAQSLAATLADEMRRLVPPHFIALYAPERFTDLMRYLQAARIRLQRGIVDPERERRYAAALTPYRQKLNALLEELTPLSSPAKRAAVEELFWMIEEYKVSLFAQELKTRVPVSPKRLDKQISQVGQLE